MTKGDKERYRVQAAIAAMQGLLSQGWPVGGSNAEDAAVFATEHADALMAELGLGEEE